MKKKINISDKTLELIRQQKIKPIPRWEFGLKNGGILLGLGLCLLLLVVGIGVSWFGLEDEVIIPYFWLILAGVFLGLSYLLFEKTKKAYRWQKWQVVGLIGLGGLMMGGVIFKIGLASRVDRNLEERLSFYRQVVPMKLAAWSNPEAGYLSGEIIKVIDVNNFTIRDFRGKTWVVTGNPLIRGRVVIGSGQEIKLIGKQVGENVFETEEIRPWNGMGQKMMKEN